MALDPSTLLDAVESAIQAFLTNGALQTYTANGMTFTRADLAKLFEQRRALRAEVAMKTVKPVRLADLGGGDDS